MDTSALPPGSGDDPPEDGRLERRVSALETSVVSIDRTLAVISEQMKHLASRDDISALRGQISIISEKLDSKASITDLAIISEKLDTKASITDLAIISGKVDTNASAIELAELKGRVARIPTVPVLASILVVISLPFAAGSWAVRHLPESWSRALQ